MQPAHDYKQKALEITMRDVMDNLENAASYTALDCIPFGLEILSIEPARLDPYAQKQHAEIVLFAKK